MLVPSSLECETRRCSSQVVHTSYTLSLHQEYKKNLQSDIHHHSPYIPSHHHEPDSPSHSQRRHFPRNNIDSIHIANLPRDIHHRKTCISHYHPSDTLFQLHPHHYRTNIDSEYIANCPSDIPHHISCISHHHVPDSLYRLHRHRYRKNKISSCYRCRSQNK